MNTNVFKEASLGHRGGPEPLVSSTQKASGIAATHLHDGSHALPRAIRGCERLKSSRVITSS